MKNSLILTLTTTLAFAACGGSESGNLFDRDFTNKEGKASVAITPDSVLGYWQYAEPYDLGDSLKVTLRMKIEQDRATVAMKCAGINGSVGYDQQSATARIDGTKVYLTQSIDLSADAQSDDRATGCWSSIPKGSTLIVSIDGVGLTTHGNKIVKLADLEK